MVEKLQVTHVVTERDAITPAERPSGPGWRLKTVRINWNEEKQEGTHTYTWERSAGEG